MSSNKQIIVKKSYLQLGKKPSNLIAEQEKRSTFINVKNLLSP